MKYTAEMAMEQEKQGLLDALCDGCIELNNEFLDRFAGNSVKEQLLRVVEGDRGYFLDSAFVIDEDNCFFNGSPASNCDNDIWLDVSEIEIQFDGDPEEYFDNVDDWTIDGDLAYLYVGYGLTVNVDVDALKENIDDSLDA